MTLVPRDIKVDTAETAVVALKHLHIREAVHLSQLHVSARLSAQDMLDAQTLYAVIFPSGASLRDANLAHGDRRVALAAKAAGDANVPMHDHSFWHAGLVVALRVSAAGPLTRGYVYANKKQTGGQVGPPVCL